MRVGSGREAVYWSSIALFHLVIQMASTEVKVPGSPACTPRHTLGEAGKEVYNDQFMTLWYHLMPLLLLISVNVM